MESLIPQEKKMTLSQLDGRLAFLRDLCGGSMTVPPETLRNLGEDYVAAIREEVKEPDAQFLKVAEVVTSFFFRSAMEPVVRFAKYELLPQLKWRDGTLAKACWTIAKQVSESSRNPSGEELLVEFWNTCNERIAQPELREEVVSFAPEVDTENLHLTPGTILPRPPKKPAAKKTAAKKPVEAVRPAARAYRDPYEGLSAAAVA